MKIMTGTVVNGKIEIPAEAFGEGARVMILAPELSDQVRLTMDEEEELFEAAQQIRRGEFVDGDELMRQLRSRRPD